jgi:hypothetical protein
MKRLFTAALAVFLPFAAYATGYEYQFTDTTNTGHGGDGTTSTLDSLAHGTAYTWGLTNASAVTGSGLAGNLTTLESALSHDSQHVTSVTLTLTGIYDWTSEPDDVLYVDVLNGLQTGARSAEYDSSPTTQDTSYGSDPLDPYNDGGKSTNYNGYTSSPGTNSGNPSDTVNLVHDTSQFALYTAHLSTSKLTETKPTATSANLIKASTGNLGNTSNSTIDPTSTPGTFTAHDSMTPVTITYTMSGTSATALLLSSFLSQDYTTTADGDVGLGLSADCHFYDSGVTLTVYTAANVPDGGLTRTLLGIALVSVAAFAKLPKKRRILTA